MKGEAEEENCNKKKRAEGRIGNTGKGEEGDDGKGKEDEDKRKVEHVGVVSSN